MKNLIALTILLALAFIAVTNAANVIWGASKPYERLLHREIVTEKRKVMRVVSKDLYYPAKGMNATAIISRIAVTDQKEPSKGGKASLRAGGPELDFATIHLKSKRNHGFSFIVEIFGN